MSDNRSENHEDTGSVLPDAGVELAPTSEQIVRGAIGNGTRDRFTSELASTIREERKVAKQETKKARTEGYNEGMKDGLQLAGKYTKNLVKLGDDILERLNQGEELTRLELDTLKLAQVAAKEVADRGVGKAVARSEVKNDTKILNLFHGKIEHD